MVSPTVHKPFRFLPDKFEAMFSAWKWDSGKQNIHPILNPIHLCNHLVQNQIRTKHKRLLPYPKLQIIKHPDPVNIPNCNPKDGIP